MTNRIVFACVLALVFSGLALEFGYWIGREAEARDRIKAAQAEKHNAEGQTAACLSGTLRLIWKDGSVTRSQPAQHYERMLLKSEMEEL